jgi:pimeloyl-ACP methyl ester carboxylesterase
MPHCFGASLSVMGSASAALSRKGTIALHYRFSHVDTGVFDQGRYWTVDVAYAVNGRLGRLAMESHPPTSPDAVKLGPWDWHMFRIDPWRRKEGPMRWSRVVLAGAALTGSAAAVQQALSVRDRRRFPPPGLLLNVEGHPMHLQVRGPDTNGPTVVLEAGMGSFSPNWHWVQEELAPTVRNVAYDRAGLGWSRRSRRQRDAQTIAMELRDALREAGIEPPYVLAGHSFGGLPVRAFADLYPELTAGLVLVDASHPDQWVRWPTPHADQILEVSQRMMGWFGWFGLLRLLNFSRRITAGLPSQQAAELRAGAALPGYAATEAAQMRSWSVSREQLNAAAPLGDLPLAVIAVSEQPVGGELLTALQRELTELTTNASFQIVQGASHESLISSREYARVVATTILSVVQAAHESERAKPIG